MSEIAVPMSLATFWDRMCPAVGEAEPVGAFEESVTAGGIRLRASVGPELWRGSLRRIERKHRDAMAAEALLSLARRPGASFLATDPRYRGPREDRGGAVLNEPIRNGVPNSLGNGAALGTLDDAGALPTGWSFSGIAAADVEGTSITPEDGRPTIRLRFAGTPSGGVFVNFAGIGDIPTVPDAVWTGSLWAQLVGGDMTNVDGLFLRVTSVGGGNSETEWTAGAAALARVAHTRTMNAGTTHVRHNIRIANSGAVDLTLKLQAPQLEPGATATEWQSTPRQPALHDLDSGNRLVQLRDLPPGYVLSPGDMLGWTYGSNPTRYALHRLVTGATAEGNGICGPVEVTPRLRGGTVGAAVDLVRPVCKAVVDQAQAGAGDIVVTSGASLTWVESVK